MVKNKKGLLAGIAVLVFLTGLYLLLKTLDLDEEQEKGGETNTVYEMDAEDIAQMKIEVDGNYYTFIHDEEWKYQEEEDFPLSESRILEVVSGITSITSSRKLTDVENLTEYGLEDPEVKVTVKNKDGKETILNFGDDNEAVSGCYMRMNEEKAVYLVDSSVKSQFAIDRNDLAEKEEIPQLTSTSIQKVEISQNGQRKTLEKNDTSATGWFYMNSENQSETSSIPADSSQVNTFMNHFSGLTWLEFVSYDTSDLTKYGLSSPVTVTIDYETSEDENQQVIFCIGSQDEEGNYYAMLKDGKYVYTLSADAVDNIILLEEENMLSPLVADYSFADLDQVTFVRNQITYTAVKKEAEKETKYYLNDKEIDQSLFSDFFSQITDMEWQKIDQGAVTSADSEMTVTFEKADNKTTIDYFPYDSNFYLAVDSQGNKMLVNKMKVKDMLQSFDSMIEEWNNKS